MDERYARTNAAGVVSYFLTDAMGSTIALTDSNGVVQTTYVYGPYGATNASGAANDNPYRFIGRELEPIASLYNMRARYLDTGMGRFVTRDPQGLSGSTFLAMYSYANNNPIAEMDPTGKDVFGGLGNVTTAAVIAAGYGGAGQAFGPGGSGSTTAAGGTSGSGSGSGASGGAAPASSAPTGAPSGATTAAQTTEAIALSLWAGAIGTDLFGGTFMAVDAGFVGGEMTDTALGVAVTNAALSSAISGTIGGIVLGGITSAVFAVVMSATPAW